MPCWHRSRSQTFPGRPDWAVEKHHRPLPTRNPLPFTSTLGNVSDALKSQNEPTFLKINGKVKRHEKIFFVVLVFRVGHVAVVFNICGKNNNSKGIVRSYYGNKLQ